MNRTESLDIFKKELNYFNATKIFAEEKRDKKSDNSTNKALVHFINTVKTSEFEKEIIPLRIRHGVPLGGLDKNSFDEWRSKNLASATDFDQILNELGELADKFNLLQGNREIRAILEKMFPFFLNSSSVNKILESDSLNLCSVDDYSSFIKKNESANSIIRQPIFIRVSPDASQRDILRLIKNEYHSSIKPLQKIYKNHPDYKKLLLGKTRKTEVLNRNDFIYDNRQLPHKQINTALRRAGFSPLDDGAIGAILSREKKRRQ